jgi:murein DD-endopeptidase MepM/ murein hydrolase activator NlpD
VPGQASPTPSTWRKLVPIASLTAVLTVGAGVASAQSGGTEPAGGGTTPAPTPEPPPESDPAPGGFKLSAAEARPHKSFFDARRKAKVAYRFEGDTPTDVRVDVTDVETGEVIASFVDAAAEPGLDNVTRWNGRNASGNIAPNGEYAFGVAGADGGIAETTDDSTFGFYRFRFPIAGRHDYGDGFGAGRGHQGQDVFAKCGTPLRAVRGGTVQWNKTHSAAGYYLVIDGKGTKRDYMYAHLQEPSALRQGERVRTGEIIAAVGDTGNASGCHLHFEVWSGPGWYEGGNALPGVARMLKLWDSWS